MSKSFFIMGTDTDIGKTFISNLLIKYCVQNNIKCIYYKPISSGGLRINDKFYSYDVLNIFKNSGIGKNINLDMFNELINPYRFKNEVSPHLAQKIECKQIDINLIIKNYKKLQENYEIVIIEGCGGLSVPLNSEYFMQYDLIKLLDVECILVSKSGLGTINHTLLTINFAKEVGIKIKGIIYNKYKNDILDNENIKTIEDISKINTLLKIEFGHDENIDCSSFL